MENSEKPNNKKLLQLLFNFHDELREITLDKRELDSKLHVLEIEKQELEVKVLKLENQNTMLKDQVLALEASTQSLTVENQKLIANLVKVKGEASEAQLKAETDLK